MDHGTGLVVAPGHRLGTGRWGQARHRKSGDRPGIENLGTEWSQRCRGHRLVTGDSWDHFFGDRSLGTWWAQAFSWAQVWA